MNRRMGDHRLLQQGLAGDVDDAPRGQPEVLHAGLGRARDAELVAHAEREDRDRVLLGGDTLLSDGSGGVDQAMLVIRLQGGLPFREDFEGGDFFFWDGP